MLVRHRKPITLPVLFLLQVAIKIIDVDKVKEDYVRRNLGREVKVLSRLRHPNIVRLYETMMVSVVPRVEPSSAGRGQRAV